MLVGEQGRPVPPELVTQLASETQKVTGADVMRVSMDPTTSGIGWRERELLDEVLGDES
jgi:hypothetical protein